MIKLNFKDELSHKLNNINQQVRVRLTSWANRSGQKIKIVTTPYVPLDKGKLEAGFFYHARVVGDSFSATFGYTSRSKKGFDYAEIQHRRIDFKHPKRGTANYLEYGVRASENEILNDAKREIDQAMKM